MSAGDRLVQPGACTWCSHPPHTDGECHTTVEYDAPNRAGCQPSRSKRVTIMEQCRCQRPFIDQTDLP